MTRRFFDPAVAEPATQVQQPTIAELMAKNGVMNSSGSPVATPISIEEKKEEPKPATDPSPAATATEAPKAEQAKPETPTPQIVEEPKAEPQKEEPKVQQQSWQEVLKSQQPSAVLKELGYDDRVVGLAKKLTESPKMIGFFNHWESKGDVRDYLKELTTDYKEMSAEEVMRHQLRREYPNAPQAALDVLYKREVIQAYGLDSDDDSVLADGKLLLEAKSERYRNEMIANQEKFLLSTPPEPKVETDNSEQLVQQEIEAQKSNVLNSEYVRSIVSNKSVSYGDGEEKFNYPIANPQEIIDIIYDTNKFLDALFDITGEGENLKLTPKTEHQILTALVARDGKKFLDAYAKHYKSLGGKSAIDPIENAKDTKVEASTDSKPEPKTIAEAMARGGRINSGGY